MSAPLAAYLAGAGVGIAGAFAPYVAVGLVVPWEATRASLTTGAVLGLCAHVLARVLASSKRERKARAFVASRVVPAALVAGVAAAVAALVPGAKAAGYAAFVANAAASAVDIWEAALVLRLRPLSVQALGADLACRVAAKETESRGA